MFYLSVVSNFVLTIILLAVSYKTHGAPTHHLTIGVQGNTPTLIVTSSETGITPEAINSHKQLLKMDYAAKSVKESDMAKKSIKTKLLKKQSLYSNKKDKPLTKQTLEEKNLLKITKPLQLKENDNKTLKETQNQAELLREQGSTSLQLDSLEITTTSPVATATVEDSNTHLQLTTLTPNQINEIPLISSTIPTQPEEMSTLALQAEEDTPSTLLLTSDAANMNISPALSATLSPKGVVDFTTTVNYNDNTNFATTSDALIQTQTETETKVNDVVVQTQKILDILPDKSVIKIENEADTDRHTQEFNATTENENLLLTTIETNAFATPSASTLVTLTTDNAEATTTSELLSLSLTMTTTTTESVVDNSNNKNEQQQPVIVYFDKGLHGSTKERAEKEERAKEAENQKSDIVFKPAQDYISTTTATQQTKNESNSAENPVKNNILRNTQDSTFSETANRYQPNKVEIQTIARSETIVTTQPTVFTETDQQTFATLKTSEEHQIIITTKSPDQADEPSNTATTETVLKLIDLEKHVVKTIDELQQPSLLIEGQHDNGHDGLKNIKKKQLVDKHYVEALLHNKQDIHTKDSVDNGKYLTQVAQGTERTTTSSANNNHSLAVGNKSVLMPIKHGYLGPILMEEKTFHVTHHADNNMTDRNQHVNNIESQLRRGHFVELKVKKEVTSDSAKIKNENIKSFSKEDKEMLEMQSDQPVQDAQKDDVKASTQNTEQSSSVKDAKHIKDNEQPFQNHSRTLYGTNASRSKHVMSESKHDMVQQSRHEAKYTQGSAKSNPTKSFKTPEPEIVETSTENMQMQSSKLVADTELLQKAAAQNKSAAVLSTTVFQVIDSLATKTPIVQADTLFTAEDQKKSSTKDAGKQQVESKISDIQIEVYDSTVDSIVASTNFKDIELKQQILQPSNDESFSGKTTKPPIAAIQQERFTQYVIDRTETSTQEPINYNTIRVASGKPEPAAIEIHINVSESFGNESEDVEFSFPQTEDSNNNKNNEKIAEESYDDSKANDNIKLKISSNANTNGKYSENDEILVVEIIDNENDTNTSFKGKSKNTDELFISGVKDIYTTPPPPPPPPPYHQANFDRDSDTIFYISNTEVKVGESPPATKNTDEERKLILESQFFPANYMASTHPNLKNAAESLQPTHHHLYEEDIILSSNRNQADSLKIYRNNNEPAPPLDVTYVGESIIEVEQSPESVITTTYAPDQQHNVATPQADVIIQPALLPEISIGVPVIGELPPQIELKEIDFMPNEPQLHRSGIYNDNDNNNDNSNNNDNDIDENTINGSSNNNHDVDIVSGSSNNKQRVDESSIQYGGDLIDESADGGFDGVEGSYPFGNPAVVGKSSSYSYPSAFLTKLRKQQQQQQPNHVADYAHLYVNYGVNNMRKDELSADVKDSGEMLLIGSGGNSNMNVPSNEQNTTSLKDFLSKVSKSNFTMPFTNVNSTHTERMSNATAFSVMEYGNDLEEKNTEDIVNLISLAIGLFIVILPVVVTCSMFWALRYLYKKYHSNLTDNGGYTEQTDTKGPLNENGVEKGEFAHEPSSSPTNSYKDTIEKYHDTSNKPSTRDNNVKFAFENPKSPFDNLPCNTNTAIAFASSPTVSKKNETLKLSLTLSSPMTQEQAKPPPSASSPLLVVTTSEYRNTVHVDVSEDDDDGDDHVELSGPANGSITKMTLENNLLIVETEERNDISRVARETKMDYNRKGVFVVEVARGIDSKAISESPVTEGNDKMLSMFDTKHNNGGLGYKLANEKNFVNNEKVQIHSPPPENQEEGPRSLHQIEEVEEPINSPHLNENNDASTNLDSKANTGLSQSDLSTSSSNDSNKGYCYGNQELYVVEQKGCSTTRPTENVVLKCDIKDVKDDDHNPGNDRYLKHSPDKSGELSKNKEDQVKTYKKPEEGESRTNSGESPEQKQNVEALEEIENAAIIEYAPQEQEIKEFSSDTIEDVASKDPVELKFNSKTNSDFPTETEKFTEVSVQTQNFYIPVEIEVHITPAEDEYAMEDKSISLSKSVNLPEEPCTLEEALNVTSPSTPETIHEPVEDFPAAATPLEIDSLQEEQQIVANNEKYEIAILAAPDEFQIDNEISQGDVDSIKDLEIDEFKTVKENAILETPETNQNQLKEDNEKELKEIEREKHNIKLLNDLETNGNLGKQDREADNPQDNHLIENNSEPNRNITLHKDLETKSVKDTLNIKEEVPKTETQSELLTNGTCTLPGQTKIQNGHADAECNGNSPNEMENGYDSILSLPEPPPTIDEQQNNDLSEQQLDSLPPPPPPEIFNLKDLPPPLTNGNADSPLSEESNNFYNILPPPPPTTLQVTASAETTTATNGKVHASPLTPPASPPANFTNNLHAGLCSQPIAVDVNGS